MKKKFDEEGNQIYIDSVQHRSSRFTGSNTPYSWVKGEADSWTIRYGYSGFWIASGSGYSAPTGRRLYRQLEDEWLERNKGRRKKGARRK